MQSTLTETTLPQAVRSLLEANNYEVDGPLKLHGAEIDLRGQSKSDPFAAPIYIECTVEYVGNDKYGNDLTKFVLVREQFPDAKLLCVSSKGFSLPVIERAGKSRIETLTYDELFAKFQRFEPYVRSILSDGTLADELSALEKIYEEPNFDDSQGQDMATAYLTQWRLDLNSERKWLIVLGEYGTGKTALTKVLLLRWMRGHHRDPSLPLPIRLELRDFTRQFDARGLLHHFLDTNGLSHIPVDFLLTMLRNGRIVLLLDGYDEMAQYMHIRERRACLEALADLAADGAIGILTSRPNYFSEAEEFHVAEALYKRMGAEFRTISKGADVLLEREKRLDQLLQSHFIERFERQLKDLTQEQTLQLVGRALASDEASRNVVLAILGRVFRQDDDGASRSLSGKPVIVTYLVELAEELKAAEPSSPDHLTEWQIYALIIDKLMIRDFHRSAELSPSDRLSFLERLAVRLARSKHTGIIDETSFRNLAESEFQNILRKEATSGRGEKLEQLFADLRSSATLTRADLGKQSGYRFSHNSIREFLCAQFLVDHLKQNKVVREEIPVSDAMRLFVASLSSEDVKLLGEHLAARWPLRNSGDGVGMMLALLWDGLRRQHRATNDPSRATLASVSGDNLACDNIVLNRIALSTLERPANLSNATFKGSTFGDVQFARADCRDCDFTACIFDLVDFRESDLSRADFRESLLIDANFTDATVQGADLRGVSEITIRVDNEYHQGQVALGYLAFNGARTDPVPSIAKYRFHPSFDVIEKVTRKLLEGGMRQMLGLTQKGAARANPTAARAFVDLLIKENYAQIPKARPTLVEITDSGRNVLSKMLDGISMSEPIVKFFES